MIKLHSADTLSKEVDRLVIVGQLTYLEAIMHYAEKHRLEQEAVVKLLPPELKEKLRIESYNRNMLGKKSPQLVFDSEQVKPVRRKKKVTT